MPLCPGAVQPGQRPCPDAVCVLEDEDGGNRFAGGVWPSVPAGRVLARGALAQQRGASVLGAVPYASRASAAVAQESLSQERQAPERPVVCAACRRQVRSCESRAVLRAREEGCVPWGRVCVAYAILKRRPDSGHSGSRRSERSGSRDSKVGGICGDKGTGQEGGHQEVCCLLRLVRVDRASTASPACPRAAL